MSEGQPPTPPAPPAAPAPPGGAPAPAPPAAPAPAPPAAPAPPGGVPAPTPAPAAPPTAAPAHAVPVAPLALEAPPAEVPAAELAEPEQPFFSVMLLDGQPIEFPVEMIGAEQDLGSGPIILEAHGRGVETATHKYIVFDSGDAALYDLAVDPDGMNNIVADPAWAGLIQELSAKLAAFQHRHPPPRPRRPQCPSPRWLSKRRRQKFLQRN